MSLVVEVYKEVWLALGVLLLGSERCVCSLVCFGAAWLWWLWLLPHDVGFVAAAAVAAAAAAVVLLALLFPPS